MNPAYWALGISITLGITAITFAFKFGNWHGKVNSELASFREFINEVRADIKQILNRLPQTPTTSASPIRLTELGERISYRIDAKNWAKATARNLIDETKDMDSFLIQEFSFDHAKTIDPDDELLEKM